ERERISLGIKQMDGDIFSGYIATHDKGSVVNGVVKAVDAKGATITLDGDVEGYLKASEFSSDRVEDLRLNLKEGDAVKAVIINIDRKNRGINLSVKASDKAEENAAMQKFTATSDNTPSSGTTNLGALLKAKMDTSKSDAQ
ncbi:MAG: S1 RNA-binding domain-containing protein, partial [Candidatus Nitrotoga sp.]